MEESVLRARLAAVCDQRNEAQNANLQAQHIMATSVVFIRMGFFVFFGGGEIIDYFGLNFRSICSHGYLVCNLVLL